MQVFTLSILLIYVSAITSFEITKIEGIEGEIIKILFDSKSNAFILTVAPPSTTLYKLDSQKNILLQLKITENVSDIFTNNKDDVYIITNQNEDSTIINILKAGTSEIQEIDSVQKRVVVYMDNDSNLFYNTDGWGVNFLKYNTSKPVIIKFSENFTISGYKPIMTNERGQTYLAGKRLLSDGDIFFQLAEITSESKEHEIPEVTFQQGILKDPFIDYYEQLAVDSRNDLLYSVFNEKSGYLKMFNVSTGFLYTIFEDEGYQYYYLQVGLNRVLITACDYVKNYNCRLSYLTIDFDVVQILNMQNLTTAAGRFINEIDDDGNIYISGKISDNTSLEFLSYNETKTVPIGFDHYVNILDLKLDGNDNVWILSNDDVGLFYIEKGTLKAVQVPGTKDLGATGFRVNKKSNEGFVYGKFGLFVIS